MDGQPDFQRALITVLVAGTLIAAAGTGVLLLVFRRFGDTKKAGGQSHMALMFALIGFIFLVCGILFALSFAK